MRTRKMAAAVGAAATMLVALQGPASAATTPLRWVSDGTVVAGSSQTVQPGSEAAAVTVVTTGLQAGHAYTLWVAVFNHPEHCVDGRGDGFRCGPLDVASPLVDASVVWGAGLVSNGGTDTFDGVVTAGQQTDPQKVAMGSGVISNPAGAEYQTIVRSHGPSDAEYPDQTTTFEGGCRIGERYSCRDVQSAGFRSEFPLTLLP